MKQRIISFFACLTLLIGLSLLLYPTISNYIKLKQQQRAISRYISTVDTIPEEDYSEMLEQAAEFNEKLLVSKYLLMNLPDDLLEEYYSLLDVNGDGIIGYINIPKADIMLPIYHGTSDAVLQEGAGHLEGSSFPLEGASVHSVISGHRGLPSALLFTNLDKLQTGDTFIIYVLSETYMYKIVGIETVTPDDADSLYIEKDKNYCTLITCTPYGINSHRLLIHGELMGKSEMEGELALQSGAEYIPIYELIIIFEIPVIILAVVISTWRVRKKR